MKQKGFTLVELLAMMVVLGVIMAVTIPNISGIVKGNKEEIGVEDANKIVNAAQQKISTKKASYPSGTNACIVMTMEFVDSNGDFKKGANDYPYDKGESYVVVKKVSVGSGTSKYKYYFRLAEKESDTVYYMVGFYDYDVYSKNPSQYRSERRALVPLDITGTIRLNGEGKADPTCSSIEARYYCKTVTEGGKTRRDCGKY